MSDELQNAVKRLRELEVFTGGPARDFEDVGRLHLIALLREGLRPTDAVLDVGCGALRTGYWLIHFLHPGRYFGIEPDQRMLEAGMDVVVGKDVIEAKKPRFSTTDDFDFSVFDGQRFDLVTARSIWTHASKKQIATMLDSFVSTSSRGGAFIASYLPAVPFGGRSGRRGRRAILSRDYRGDDWVGHDHGQGRTGLVAHSPRWIRKECEARQLEVRHLRHSITNMQVWLKITRT